MKTAPFVRQIFDEKELHAMNAEQIKKEVLSGQPRNSLEQQRAARQSRGVVGKLDFVADFNAAAEATPEALKKLNEELVAFRASWPQVILDASEDGMHNKTKIAEWLKARNASFTASNFVECVNDIFEQLVFAPTRIGMASLGERMLGSVMVRSTTSAQFEKLLAAFTEAPKTIEEMDAETYNRSHPDAWEDLRAPAKAMEERYVLDAVEKFKQLAPQYISSNANAQLLVKETTARGLRINQASLLAVFQELVAAKRMSVNESVDATAGSTRRFDFAGQGCGSHINAHRLALWCSSF